MELGELKGLPVLATVVMGNSVLSWMLAIIACLAVYLGLRAVHRLIIRRMEKFYEGRDRSVVFELSKSTSGFVLLMIALSVGDLFVATPDMAGHIIKSLLIIALIVQAAVWGSKLVTFFLVSHLRQRGEEDASSLSAISLLTFIAQFAIWCIAALLILENLNVDVTALVAGLGIGGIAVALAVQNILGDLLASLSIVLDKPFAVGDFIIVGDVSGTVEKIGIKTSRVRSISGEQIILPNSDLLSSRVRNFKRMYERRVVFTVGVVYNTPEAQVRIIPEIISEAIKTQERTRLDRVHFKSFGDFALIYEAVYFVLVPEYAAYMDIQQAINLFIYRRFTEESIEFAFPTQTLFVEPGRKPLLYAQKQVEKG